MKDSERSHIHIDPSTTLYFEEWMKSKLEFDDIMVAPEHQPLNLDEDDSVTPDQGSSLSLRRSVKKTGLSGWEHLGLNDLASLQENEIDRSIVGVPDFGRKESDKKAAGVSSGDSKIKDLKTADRIQQKRLFSKIPR